jgi:hypothetical protein
MAPQEWDHVIDVNLSGAFYLSKVILQHMLDRGYGRIINISSAIGSANLDGRCRTISRPPTSGLRSLRTGHGCAILMQHLMLMVSSGVPPPTACEVMPPVDRLCRSQGGPLPGWTTRERSGLVFPPRIGEARLSQGDGSRRARPYGWHKNADPDRLANTWRRQGTSFIVAGERIYGGGL